MLNMLSHIEENSIDCVITDPPYELGFMGKSWDSTGIAFNPETWEKCFKALKPGGYLLAFGGSRTFHRIACAIEDAGFELRDTIMYLYGTGFPKSMNIAKGIEAKEKYGKSNTVTKRVIEQESEGQSYTIKQTNNGAMGEIIETTRKNYEPSTELANQWQGWGTCLKPAFEPIIMARKPIKTTVAENVMIYGVGGINIDECRVETEDKWEGTELHNAKDGVTWGGALNSSSSHELCRFPANVIHDGSEETTDNMQDASRYFYTAKASKKDRDEGLDINDPQKVNDGRKTLIDNTYQRVETLRKNIHPTVKPCELMQYLIRLVAPKGATILDPFMGSGSTGKAAMFENRERNADYKFIGIDLEKQYCEIAEMRIDYALNKYEYDFKQELQESKEKGQLNLFDMEETL